MLLIKRGDIIITATVLLVAVTLGFIIFFGSSSGKSVTIKQHDELLYEVPLDEDKTITLESNTVEIKDGKVDVTNATCKNQVCVKHKKISKSGEIIACVPNGILITVE